MSKISLKRLESNEDMREFIYHIREIIEIQDDIYKRIKKLDNNWGNDQKKMEKLISYLEVDIFDHLLYHIRELRGPFDSALERVFGKESGGDYNTGEPD